MSSVAPFVPGLEVRTRFVYNNTPDIRYQSPFIFGPAAFVLRYDNQLERDLGFLGQYSTAGEIIDGANQIAFNWPQKPVGSTIDEDFTRLYVANALLKYWEESPTSSFKIVGRNQITHASKNFITNGVYAADAGFGDREVRVGDRVLVKGTLDGEPGGTPFTLASYVQSLGSEFSAGSIAAAAAVTGTSTTNAVLVETVATGASNQGAVVLTADAAGYDGRAVGRISEVYTIEVIQASTGDDATTARLRVTSDSGTDNQAVVIPAAFGSATAIGTRGLEVTFADDDGDLALGDTYTVTVRQVYTAPSLTSSGSYAVTDQIDRRYLVEVVSGGAKEDSLVLRVSETSGRDSAAMVSLVVDGAGDTQVFTVGTKGVTLQIDVTGGLVKGDKWLIVATAPKPTNYRTLTLAHSFPSAALRDDSDVISSVELFLMDNIEIPRLDENVPGEVNFVSKETEITIKSSLSVNHPQWTINGVLAPLTLEAPAEFINGSQLYVTYRAWLAASSSIQAITFVSTELDSAIDGPTDEDNPLKLAINYAGKTNGSAPVYWFNVGDPAVPANWDRALSQAANMAGIYGFVPLTHDSDILDSVVDHVETLSGPRNNQYRVAWLCIEHPSTAVIVDETSSSDEEAVLATITDDPDTSGTQNTVVTITSDNAELLQAAVRAGDRLRTEFAVDIHGVPSYVEFVVDRVIDENTLVLVSGPTTEYQEPIRIEIHRDLTANERVTAISTAINRYSGASARYAAVAGSDNQYAGHRVRVLPFDTVVDGTTKLPSYYAAAMLAASRGALAPHQSMTRMALPSLTDVEDISFFSIDQLNEIAAAGGFILMPVRSTGEVVVRHAVTAGDWDNVNTREEMVISNLDSINTYFYSLLDPYIGKANAVDETFAKINNDLTAGRNYLQTANKIDGLGGQLVDMQIVSHRRSPIGKDTSVIQMLLELPGPLNRIINNVYVQ